MIVARPRSGPPARSVVRARMTEEESQAAHDEAERLASVLNCTDARGFTSTLIRALLKQHLSLPARDRNKVSKFME